MRLRMAGILFLAIGFFLTAGPADGLSPFSQGDVVCFVGDSITHSGQYHVYLAAYYATRVPDRPVKFYNLGIGGHTAELTLVNFGWDVPKLNPAVVVVMLGMNDMGHRRFSAATRDAISRLAAYAGAWRVAPPGNAIAADSEILMIHPLTDGKVELTLKKAAALWEVPPGRLTSVKALTHTVELKAGETYLFEQRQALPEPVPSREPQN